MLLGCTGTLLLLGGVGLAIWTVILVYQSLFHPADIPLLELLLTNVGSHQPAVEMVQQSEGFTVRGSKAVIGAMLAGILLIALGGIVHALISGGVRLLGSALGEIPAKRGRSQSN